MAEAFRCLPPTTRMGLVTAAPPMGRRAQNERRSPMSGRDSFRSGQTGDTGCARSYHSPSRGHAAALALALIVARLLEPAAKLATARMLDPATASHSLGEMLGLGPVVAKEVYAALDWLGREQPFIEATLARRHLKDGALLLYDVTSTPAFAGAGSISKDAAANWRGMATAATTVATGRS